MNQDVLHNFNMEIEKLSGAWSAIGGLIGRGSAITAGLGQAAIKGIGDAPINISKGVARGFKSMTPAASSEFKQRMASAVPTARSSTGQIVATPLKSKSTMQFGMNQSLPSSIDPANIKTTYQRGGRTVNIADERARKFKAIQSKTPAARFGKIGKGVIGGAGLGLGIAGAGTVWGGLTMDPSMNSSFSGEGPSAQGPVYGA